MPRVNLGLIYVERLRHIDRVFLSSSKMRIFTLSCGPSTSRLLINQQFLPHTEEEWVAILKVYLRWRRKSDPRFKLPNYSGRTRSGLTHPWRAQIRPPKPPDPAA